MKTQTYLFAVTALCCTSMHAASMTHGGKSVFKLRVAQLCPQDKQPCQTKQISQNSESKHRKMLFMNLLQVVGSGKNKEMAKTCLALAQKMAVTQAEKACIKNLQQLLRKQEPIKTECKA